MQPVSSSPFVKNFFQEPLHKEHSLALRVSVVVFHIFTLCIPLIVYHLFIKPVVHPWDRHLAPALQSLQDVLENRDPKAPLACRDALDTARKAVADIQPSDERPLDSNLKRCEQAFARRYNWAELRRSPNLVWPAICVAYWARLLVLNELPRAILRKSSAMESSGKRIRDYVKDTPDRRYLGSRTLEFGIHLDYYGFYLRDHYERLDQFSSSGLTQEQKEAFWELRKHSSALKNAIVPNELQTTIAFHGTI